MVGGEILEVVISALVGGGAGSTPVATSSRHTTHNVSGNRASWSTSCRTISLSPDPGPGLK
jgi:hypothetical protein